MLEYTVIFYAATRERTVRSAPILVSALSMTSHFNECALLHDRQIKAFYAVTMATRNVLSLVIFYRCKFGGVTSFLFFLSFFSRESQHSQR